MSHFCQLLLINKSLIISISFIIIYKMCLYKINYINYINNIYIQLHNLYIWTGCPQTKTCHVDTNKTKIRTTGQIIIYYNMFTFHFTNSYNIPDVKIPFFSELFWPLLVITVFIQTWSHNT